MSGQQCLDEDNSGHFQNVEQLGEDIGGDSLALDRFLSFLSNVDGVDTFDLIDSHCEENVDYAGLLLANNTESTDNVAIQSTSSRESSQSSSQNLDCPDKKYKKKPLSPYMLFSKENFHIVKSEANASNASMVGRKLGTMWNNLPPAEKQIYVDRAKELKEQGVSTAAIEKPSGVKKKAQKRPRAKKSPQIVGSVSSTELSNGSFVDAFDSQQDFLNEMRPLSVGRPMSVESRCSTDASRSPVCPSYIVPQNQPAPQQHQGFHQILESQRSHSAQSFQVGQSFAVLGQQVEGNYMQQPLYQQQLPQGFNYQNVQSLNANHQKLIPATNPHSYRFHAQAVDHHRTDQQTTRANSNFYPVNSVPNVMMMKQGLDINNLMNILRAQDEEIKNLKNHLRSALATNYNLMNVMGRHGLLGLIQNGHQN